MPASLGASKPAIRASRVGIHLGEVVLRESSPDAVARGAKPLELEGLAKAGVSREAKPRFNCESEAV